MGSRSKRTGKLKQVLVDEGDFPRLRDYYEQIPFVNENGDIKKQATSPNIQMNYCPNCDSLQPPIVAGYCGLCGKHGTTMKAIKIQELQTRGRKKGIHWIKPKGYED